jgi:crotonobetainyl-CoA:carnitine CoA-transferase CaiB-like acyl-CoA transferase
MRPLESIRVLSLALNLPGPVAVARLRQLGAAIIKVEPLEGDPLAEVCPQWYGELHQGLAIVRLDLKEAKARGELFGWLEQADILITASRSAALRRLGLAWTELNARWPQLSHVAIVGSTAPADDVPGHDLTYQARHGLLTPPLLPRTCLADLAGAEQVVSAVLAAVLARQRDQGAHYIQISLAEAARQMAAPLYQGLTAPGGTLGGGFAGYSLYRAREGWIAVAALERHFLHKLQAALGGEVPTAEALQGFFLARTAAEWEQWAMENDLPLVAVRDVHSASESAP